MTGSPEVLKLKNAGDGITLRIAKCEKMSVGSYPEVSFVGVDANGRLCEVRVPQKSADRQIDRLELTYGACVGETLTITRSPNATAPSKPFWDVVRADEPIDAPQRVAPNTATAKTAAPVAGQSASSGQTEKKSALYERITDHVLKKIVPKYTAAGIPITQEGTAAIVATLFINGCNGH